MIMICKRYFFIPIALIFILIGCGDSNHNTQNNNVFTKLSTTSPMEQNDSNKSKELLARHEEIRNIHAVNGSKNMIIAFEVHHHERFRLKEIEKNIQKELKNEFPKLNITVSTDKKIILETRELEKKINDRALSKEEIGKKVKKIMKLAKEQT